MQLPRASEAAPDKVASLSTRQRVHAVSVAWEVVSPQRRESRVCGVQKSFSMVMSSGLGLILIQLYIALINGSCSVHL